MLLASLEPPARLVAEAVKDREGAVRQDQAKLENSGRWIYNDVEKGFAEAARTGKPLLVTLRCVPCVACSGIDAQVLLEEATLKPLLDQFVCVRVINANTLDLSLFQFDYDLSFSVLFFNADRTVYGRFGSWTHQKNAQSRARRASGPLWREPSRCIATIKGTRQTWRANRRTHAVQRTGGHSSPGGEISPRVGLERPGGEELRALHMVGDAFRGYYRSERLPMPLEWLYPFPQPETIGLSLAPEKAATVSAVEPASAAALAGLQVGDGLLKLGGQPLVSTADVSWILHRAPDGGATLPVELLRGGRTMTVPLVLSGGWRLRTDVTGRAAVWPMRGMALGGLVVEELGPERRHQRGIDDGNLALFVKGVGKYGNHAAAGKAGFHKDDIVVEIDGLTTKLTESEILGHLLTKRFPGEKVKTVVLRGDKRVELMLPMQ
ncbi:MAG: PDZ domain-containing protein [Verrucomicrobiales bacterium]